jgi:hypothetical protein
MRLFLIVAAAASLVALGAASPARPVVRCGTVSVHEYGVSGPVVYRVRIVTGRVSCRTARRVLGVFLGKDVSPRGWYCARGHASQSQAWAAACGTRAGALVRAYGPVRR